MILGQLRIGAGQAKNAPLVATYIYHLILHIHFYNI